MVRYYGNHPSIYLWCAHNEPTHNRYTLDPLLDAALKQAASTRLVKEVSDFREHPYPGWYWGNLRDFLAVPGAPLPSEFGAQALPRLELLQQVLGDAAWPPQWETWVYHNFQPDQTFRVANIDMGDSLEDFVANSQSYQAYLIKFAVEAFRRAKGKVSGYFQFMFVDPWEAITWAVLDVQREPKPGYFALKEASAPVMLSFVPFREDLEPGQPPFSEAWVINDLARSLDLKVDFRLEGDEKVPLITQEHRVEAQSAQCIFNIGEFYERATSSEDSDAFAKTLKGIVPGEYRLVGEAWEGETLLSRNELNLDYLAPLVDLGAGW
jgi:beta-mannosidase